MCVESLVDTFDFTITQPYDGEKLYTGEIHSLWDLSRNKLALHMQTRGTML